MSNANSLDTSSSFVNTLAAELVVNGVSSVMAVQMENWIDPADDAPEGSQWQRKLGGGFKYFLCSPLFREDFQFDEHIFQMGWLKPPTRKVNDRILQGPPPRNSRPAYDQGLMKTHWVSLEEFHAWFRLGSNHHV